LALQEIDYNSPHECPVYGEEIDPTTCIETIMALDGLCRIDIVPELSAVSDIDRATEICGACKYQGE
jgi:hypothetical protein